MLVTFGSSMKSMYIQLECCHPVFLILQLTNNTLFWTKIPNPQRLEKYTLDIRKIVSPTAVGIT